jgi:hypothetical protein
MRVYSVTTKLIMGTAHVGDSPGWSTGSAGAGGFPAAMQAILVAQIPEYAKSTSPPRSAVAAADEVTASALHRVKVFATKIFAAAL